MEPMRCARPPTRTTALSATTTTLVALVAMSAAVASPAQRDAETARSESNVVRVVAAAVAAAARDLMGSDRCAAALVLLEPASGRGGAGPARVADPPAAPAPVRLLAERLLDLPPPAC